MDITSQKRFLAYAVGGIFEYKSYTIPELMKLKIKELKYVVYLERYHFSNSRRKREIL